ncbi:glycosyltransferase family 9 protein [Butyricimonas synergistica]|uniref:glycosyltransferase family 9 protein n=1 Tax=Butyricimonas synergistica TaxID=544644 RepID=UPI0003762AD0|nr:glycosyltransferase family 9 protein [Butyricimonas synergistica]
MPVKKVLVIRFRRVGDAVLSVVICSTIRKSFPDAEIHYVVNESIEPLFRDHPDVDRVITFSDRENNHFFTYLAKVYRLMRKERYDVIVDTRSTLKTLWFSIFSLGTKYRIGTRKYYNLFFHNYRVRNQQYEELDEVSRNLLLVKPLEREGQIVYETDFKLQVTDEERYGFRRYMVERGIDFSRLVVLCTPFTRVVDKKWDIQKMKEVLSRLVWKYNAQLIFNYSKEEKAEALALYDEMEGDKHIFVNVEADSLRKLVAMLSLSDFFFGNEGGPRHMAQACGIPGLAIYPPWVNKQKWLPSRDERYQGISPLDFIPEAERGMLLDGEMFDRLTVEQVWDRLDGMLRKIKKST